MEGMAMLQKSSVSAYHLSVESTSVNFQGVEGYSHVPQLLVNGFTLDDDVRIID